MRWTWLLVAVAALLPSCAQAQNVGWLGNVSGNWNTGANWGVGGVVPTAGAEFSTSPNTSIGFTGNASINRLRFIAGAPAYTFTVGSGTTFTVAGVGVVNNSAFVQTFNVGGGTLELTSTAQPATSLANSAVNVSSGALNLRSTSTAGSATITATGGTTSFWNTATAGSATINAVAGDVNFEDSSTAGSAIINTSGGVVTFVDTSTIGNATINTTAGYTQISDSATAGTSTLNVSGTGTLAFYHNANADHAVINFAAGANGVFVDTASAGNAAVNVSGGSLRFYNTSTAASSTITATGGVTAFWNASSAGSATINTSGGVVNFQDTSTAGSATINTSSGFTQISDSAVAGTSTHNVSGNGTLGFYHNASADKATITQTGGTVRFLDATTAGEAVIGLSNGNLAFRNTATAGDATITVSGGTVNLYETATAGHATLSATGGRTTFRNSSSAGASAITVSGTGVVDFLNTSTVGDATITTSAGFTQISDNAVAGTSTLNVGGAGTLAFYHNANADRATINVAAGGGGGFHDTTSAGRATINVTGGSYNLFDSATADRAAINVSGGVTSFRNMATAGNATINTAGGTVNFQDTSSAGSATINTTAGWTQISDAARAGTSMLNVSGTGVLAFYRDASAERATIDINGNYRDHGGFHDNSSAADATMRIRNAVYGFYENTSAGRASISMDNSALYFENTATAAGAALTASRGIIDFYDTSSAGNATITVQNGASIGFFDNSSGGLSRIIIGAGSDLDMRSHFSSLTVGSIEGEGTVYLGRRTLIVGGNDLSTTVSGRIVDGVSCCSLPGGSLTKVGSGTLTLSGDNTYRGTTTVTAGALMVNGSIASSSLTRVEAATLLGGSGTVGTTQINGGTLSPGNSIGTLSVAGSLTLTAASTYLVEVSPTASDTVQATGTANPGGATVRAVFAPGAYVSRRYTILSAAGGVNGTFGALQTVDLPARFTSMLSYDATSAYLDLQFGFTPPVGGFSDNQKRVADALVGGFNTLGGLPGSFASLDGRGLSQASGEAATGALQAAFMAQSQFINALTDPSVGDAGAEASNAPQPMSYAAGSVHGDVRDAFAQAAPKPSSDIMATERGWRMFGAAYGGEARVGGSASAGSHDLTGRVVGMMAGADLVIAPGRRIGFALGGGNTSYGLSDGMGTGRSDMFHAGMFGRQSFGEAGYLSGAFAYGWHDVHTDRIGPGGEQLRAGYQANLLAGRVEAGWRVTTMGAAITPYGAVQAMTYMMPSHAETGSGGPGSFALAYAGGDVTATRVETGLRFDRTLALDNARVTLRARSAWLHHLDDARVLSATFQSLPGIGFLVSGATPAKDAAFLSLGSEIVWTNGFALATSFDGEVSANVTSYVGKGSLRYRW